MAVPGSNLLKRAAKLIKLTSVQYYSEIDRTLNAARQYVSTYGDPFTLPASVQMVPRNKYAFMGLDFNSFYVSIYASADLIDLQRDSGGDRFIWQGDLYQMSNANSWFAQDGWASALAVRVRVGATGPL